MSKFKEFSSSEIPNKVIEGIANALENYSTAMIKLSIGLDGMPIQELMGSGTYGWNIDSLSCGESVFGE